MNKTTEYNVQFRNTMGYAIAESFETGHIPLYKYRE